MGGMSYSSLNAESSRSVRGTYTNTVEQNFTQIKERKSHPTMKSQGILLREARDSEVHPCTFPIIFALDLTGSMQMIPQNLIQEGLPKMISSIIQGGVQSPAVLFMGVGDHEVDREPLQIGQFESGDKELDLWLSRTYLEGGGGANSGESYSLAHYFAARHTVTDSFEKRSKKGLLITIGDEPNLKTYPSRAMNEIMGPIQAMGFTDKEILEEAQQKWEVFHINPRDSEQPDWRNTKKYWKDLLGQNYIGLSDYKQIPQTVADLVIRIASSASDIKTSDTPKADLKKDSDGAETPSFL